MADTLKIAIIGAGPAGCTLARLLLKSEPSFNITIYEGEASVNARPQGGTLDLHGDTGLAAMKKAGLYDQFLKYARFDGESLQIADKKFRRWIDVKGSKDGTSKTGRPEIDRSRLREILVDSLPPDMIKWNHRLRSVSEDSHGRVSLHFDHAVVSDFDLLVGADGAWSKIRPLVSDVKPYYSGVGGVRSLIPDAANTHPDLYDRVRQGSLFSYSDHKSLMMQQLGDGSITVYTWAAQPPTSPPYPSAAELKEEQLRQFADWDPRLIKALEVGQTSATVTDIYMLPIGHAWRTRQGVTLVGDAAHLMGPFAGEGVNAALADSMRLAEAIVSGAKTAGSCGLVNGEIRQKSLSDSIADFEQEMLKRATVYQQLTWDSLEMMFLSPAKGPNDMIEKWVYSHAEDHVPWGLKWLLAAGVYTYFFIFRLLKWG